MFTNAEPIDWKPSINGRLTLTIGTSLNGILGEAMIIGCIENPMKEGIYLFWSSRRVIVAKCNHFLHYRVGASFLITFRLSYGSLLNRSSIFSRHKSPFW
jgi:hypothetical protein